ncbi:MAG: CocE/NonD family hydrolase [Actinomycetota bacterium]
MLRRILAAAVLVVTALPVAPAQAALVYEVEWVESVGGALIRVETRRDPAFDPQPVLLTYSPYTVLAGAQPAADGLASRYNRLGIARAVAHVIGTGGSTGCWDYGGAAEQQSGVDVVNHLASRGWSNGSVGMIGVSYEGTTATMVAARGDDAPGLKAIVPIAAISRWYSYAFHDGVRYFQNSEYPNDQGFDTPLLFDLGFAKTVSRDRGDPRMAEVVASRAAECGAIEHTAQAYSRNPDYGDFWLERDYRKDAANFRASVFLVHGWQDFNVKQEEAIGLWEALREDDPNTPQIEGPPLMKMWLTQEPHSDGTGPGYAQALDAFLQQTLLGIDMGAEDLPTVTTAGRDHTGPLDFQQETSWPPAGTETLDLYLGRSFTPLEGAPQYGLIGSKGESGTLRTEPQDDGAGWTHADTGAATEEISLRDPLNRDGHGYYSLFHRSEPLSSDMRIAGAAELDAYVETTTPGQYLAPLLVDEDPDGTLSVIQRGFLNLDYRDGLSEAKPATGRMRARVRFLPQDYTIRAGHRIGVILQGSNAVWAVPGNPGLTSYAMGPVAGWTSVGTRLRLPVASFTAGGDYLPK